MTMDNTYEENISQSPTEKIYFFGLILYILQYLQYETQWDYGPSVDLLLQVIVLFSLSAHMLSTLIQCEKDSFRIVFLFSLIVTIVVGTNARFIPESSLLYSLLVTLLLVFGAMYIDFQKIVKTYLVVGGAYCIVTVMASLLGVINNISDVYIRDDDVIGAVDNFYRMCFGYGWSTNMANHVFFIILAFFYWISRPFNKIEILMCAIISSFVLYYTGSRLSTFCVFLMLSFTLCYKTIFGKRMLTNSWLLYLLIFCIPFFAIISFLVTNAYDETDMTWMITDVVLSGRLHIGQDAFEMAGIPLWGQFYEMFGSARDDGDAYNYLDNSYVQSLVIYGLIYTFLLVVGYVVTCWKAFNRKDYFLIYSIFLAGFSGLIAQHFIEIYMNPFLIALFANHSEIEVTDGYALDSDIESDC